MKSDIIEISGLLEPMLLKDYLRRSGYSVTLLKKVKFAGLYLNGERVTVRATVKNGDHLRVDHPDEQSEIEPMSIPLRVLYEDEELLAVDKPTNMPTHPSRGNSLPTLANAVMGMYGGDFVFRSVNRLDRDTSGIVLIAKTQMSAGTMSEAMKSGAFRKRYECIVEGTPTPDRGVIDQPIEREQEGSVKRIVRPDGKRALTEYEVIANLCDRSLCGILLHTGRTHQIRVHMAYIGHPLVGDFLYGRRESGEFYLRCTEIEFPHPKTGERMKICADSKIL